MNTVPGSRILPHSSPLCKKRESSTFVSSTCQWDLFSCTRQWDSRWWRLLLLCRSVFSFPANCGTRVQHNERKTALLMLLLLDDSHLEKESWELTEKATEMMVGDNEKRTAQKGRRSCPLWVTMAAENRTKRRKRRRKRCVNLPANCRTLSLALTPKYLFLSTSLQISQLFSATHS